MSERIDWRYCVSWGVPPWLIWAGRVPRSRRNRLYWMLLWPKRKAVR